MKKFLEHIISRVIILVILFFIIHCFYQGYITKIDDSGIDIKFNSLKKKENLDLIIMGDSRAERQISPKIIDSVTDINSINLAISSGDINRIRKFFINNQKFLNEVNKNQSTLLISASDWQINDNSQSWGYLSLSTFSLLSPLERIKFLNNKSDYFRFIYNGYKTYIIKVLGTSLMNNKKTSDSDGFLGIDREFSFKDSEKIKLENHPYYSKINYNGWRFKLFEDSLRYLNSNFDNVIIMIPPTTDYWKLKTKNTDAQKMTLGYIERLKNLVLNENLMNIKIWDLYNFPPENINDSDFYDIEHLNVKGAKKLSLFISKKLHVN